MLGFFRIAASILYWWCSMLKPDVARVAGKDSSVE
jgi:hypothetical protein